MLIYVCNHFWDVKVCIVTNYQVFWNNKFKEKLCCKTNLPVSWEVATLHLALTWLSSNAHKILQVTGACKVTLPLMNGCYISQKWLVHAWLCCLCNVMCWMCTSQNWLGHAWLPCICDVTGLKGAIYHNTDSCMHDCPASMMSLVEWVHHKSDWCMHDCPTCVMSLVEWVHHKGDWCMHDCPTCVMLLVDWCMHDCPASVMSLVNFCMQDCLWLNGWYISQKWPVHSRLPSLCDVTGLIFITMVRKVCLVFEPNKYC